MSGKFFSQVVINSFKICAAVTLLHSFRSCQKLPLEIAKNLLQSAHVAVMFYFEGSWGIPRVFHQSTIIKSMCFGGRIIVFVELNTYCSFYLAR